MEGRKALWLLGGLLSFQVLVSLPRLGLPFIDGRLHWNYDPAYYLLRSFHGHDGTWPGPWKALGLDEYRYDEDGRVVGLSHYAHHPVLPSAILSAYSGVVGFREWVPRSLALFFSLLGTILLFLLGREEIGADEPAAALALLYVLLPLPYNYQDSRFQEAMVSFWMLLALWLLGRRGEGVRRWALPSCLGAALLSGWAAYPFVAGVLILLALRRGEPGGRGTLRAGAGAAAGAAVVNLALLLGLGISPQALAGRALLRMGLAERPAPWGEWLRAQAGFLDANFGQANLLVLVCLLLYAVTRLQRDRLLLQGGGLLIGSGAVWTLAFHEQSLTHHYVQWPIGLGYVLLLAWAWSEAARRLRWGVQAARQALLVAAVPLLAFSAYASVKLETSIHSSPFGEPKDLMVLLAAPRRLVVARDGSSGPPDWWISPNVCLYSDPFYKAYRGGGRAAAVRGRALFVDQVTRLDPEGDLVVSLKSPVASARLERELRARFGIQRLRYHSQSPTFAFWTPVPTGGRYDKMAPEAPRP